MLAGDAMADAVDAAELLGIEVQQFARPLALVAHDRRLRVQISEPAEPQPAQDTAHRRTRQAELFGDAAPALALSPQPLDRLVAFAGRRIAVSRGRRAAVLEGDLAARPIPLQPFVGPPYGQANRHGGIGNLPTLILDPQNHQESTWRRQPRILVNVHPGTFQAAVDRSRNHSFPVLPRMNNLHSFDT